MLDGFYESLSDAVFVLEALARGQAPDPLQAAVGGFVLECLSIENRFRRASQDYDVAAVAKRLDRIACGGHWEYDDADRIRVSNLVAAVREYLNFIHANPTVH